MCFIKRNEGARSLTPLIAENDIPVYKILNHYSLKNIKQYMITFWRKIQCLFLGVSTPYRFLPILFIKGKAALRANFGKNVLGDTIYINAGIHSYCNITSYVRAECAIRDGRKIHKAIIPKGTEYYTNEYNEAVSTKLIIYKETINHQEDVITSDN